MQKQKADKEFVQMIQQNEGIIYKVASFYATTEYPIQDLYQEIVLNLLKAYSSFRGDSKQATWMYRISLNTCISFIRKRKVDLSFTNIQLELPDISEGIEDIQLLYKLINNLGKIEKALILLYLEDKSYKEIAEITGLTVTNVATSLSRAKQKMKEMSEKIQD